MFVSKKTHEMALAQLRGAVKAHNDLAEKWTALVRRINKLGGEDFLRHARLPGRQPAPQFSADDLQRLIQLCHPDKHDGKAMATEMTQKLILMKERL